MSARTIRVLRGLSAAGFATFVAALFHVAGGGSAPGLPGLALAIAFSSLACIALAGARLSLLRTSLSVALSQLLFHSLLSVGVAAAEPGVSGTGRHDHTIALLDTTAVAPPVGVDRGMLLAHAAAALITIAAARRGEWALLSLYRTARLRLLRVRTAFLVAVVRPEETPRFTPPTRVLRASDLRVLLGTMRWRGPPAPFAVTV